MKYLYTWLLIQFPSEFKVYLASGLETPKDGETILDGAGLIAHSGRDLTGAIVLKTLSDEMVDCIFALTFFVADMKLIAEHIQNAVAFGMNNPYALGICKQRKEEGCTPLGVPFEISGHLEPLFIECVTIGMAIRASNLRNPN